MRLFDMLTRADIQRLKEQTDPGKRVKELENSLSIALDINEEHQREIEKLKAELAREKEDHQYDNLVHDKELKNALQR